MDQENKYMLERFEEVIWQYMASELSENEMKFWQSQINKNVELQNLLEDYSGTDQFYKSAEPDDISDLKFEKALNAAFESKSENRFKVWVKKLFPETTEISGQGYKLIFGSAMAIIASLIFLFSDKSNPVKDIGNELFSWNDNVTTNTIHDIENSLYLMKNKNVEKTIKKKFVSDPWNSQILSIKNKLEQIQTEISKNNL
ncbi:MAG: hypothetical protein ACEPO8_14360 [Rhodothermaceae bacterium]